MTNSRNILGTALGLFVFLLLLTLGAHDVYAQASNLTGSDQGTTEMTLWQTLKAGGELWLSLGFSR